MDELAALIWPQSYLSGNNVARMIGRMMTTSTLTRSALITLSEIPPSLENSDAVFGNLSNFRGPRGDRDNSGLLTILRRYARTSANGFPLDYRYPWVLDAAATYNNAVIENDHHDALRLNDIKLTGQFAPIEDRTAQHSAIVAMRAREEASARNAAAQASLINDMREQSARLIREINTLREPVTRGDDPRMTEFWGLAADAANEAGFCPEYDRIAEAMGGVSRSDMSVDYQVELSIQTTVYLNVTAGRGVDIDMEYIRSNFTRSDINAEVDASWDDIDVEGYEEN